jgi:hypothetical protein
MVDASKKASKTRTDRRRVSAQDRALGIEEDGAIKEKVESRPDANPRMLGRTEADIRRLVLELYENHQRTIGFTRGDGRMKPSADRTKVSATVEEVPVAKKLQRRGSGSIAAALTDFKGVLKCHYPQATKEELKKMVAWTEGNAKEVAASASQLSQEQAKDVADIFSRLDKMRSGDVAAEQVATGLQGGGLSDEEVNTVFKAAAGRTPGGLSDGKEWRVDLTTFSKAMGEVLYLYGRGQEDLLKVIVSLRKVAARRAPNENLSLKKGSADGKSARPSLSDAGYSPALSMNRRESGVRMLEAFRAANRINTDTRELAQAKGETKKDLGTGF